MTQILHLDASPRSERSHSRRLADQFMSAWQKIHVDDLVIYRDLGHQSLPYVNENWVAAAFTPPEKHTPELTKELELSELLIEEFKACDRYVFSIPMHNFTVPAIFKSYIDQIVRVNRTFKVSDQGVPLGLIQDKKMLIVTARGGGYQPGTPTAAYDFQEPYLRTIFGFIGITDINFIHAENLNSGADARTQSLNHAVAALEKMVANW
jgi:FMN-dependent NADH-azoreductase